MAQLTKFDDVVYALGGASEVAKMLGRNASAVSQWRKRREKFPAGLYRMMQDELKKRGHSAPDSLWRVEERVKRGRRQRRPQASGNESPQSTVAHLAATLPYRSPTPAVLELAELLGRAAARATLKKHGDRRDDDDEMDWSRGAPPTVIG